MIGREWSDFWWNNITGAYFVVTQITDVLLNNATAIIDVPSDLPWRKQMRSAVESGFRNKTTSPEVIIEIIDAADDCSYDIMPGKFLLQQYGQSREICNGYRDRSKRTIQEYLKEKSVLKNRIVWVKGLSGKQADEWLKFCKDYYSESSETGLFVLEIHEPYTRIEYKKLTYIKFHDFVTSYDVQLFNSFILDESDGLNSNWKRYISTAAASLCSIDAEISELILRTKDLKKTSMLSVIEEIADYPQYRLRGGDELSTHVLAYQRKGELTELEHRLWKAQIQTLFPLIEMERVKMINSFKTELKKALENNHIEQYEEQLKEPVEIELGTLCYMLSAGLIHVENRDVRDRIYFLHICRNLLAHAHCCNTEQVSRLLDQNIAF